MVRERVMVGFRVKVRVRISIMVCSGESELNVFLIPIIRPCNYMHLQKTSKFNEI